MTFENNCIIVGETTIPITKVSKGWIKATCPVCQTDIIKSSEGLLETELTSHIKEGEH